MREPLAELVIGVIIDQRRDAARARLVGDRLEPVHEVVVVDRDVAGRRGAAADPGGRLLQIVEGVVGVIDLAAIGMVLGQDLRAGAVIAGVVDQHEGVDVAVGILGADQAPGRVVVIFRRRTRGIHVAVHVGPVHRGQLLLNDLAHGVVGVVDEAVVLVLLLRDLAEGVIGARRGQRRGVVPARAVRRELAEGLEGVGVLAEQVALGQGDGQAGDVLLADRVGAAGGARLRVGEDLRQVAQRKPGRRFPRRYLMPPGGSNFGDGGMLGSRCGFDAR